MKTFKPTLLLFALVVIAITACRDTEQTFPVTEVDDLDLPTTMYNYESVNIPSTQVENLEDNTPTHNPVTNAGATLGRVLFYDKKLSLNNRVSCGSCHKQNLAFSDNASRSEGFEGENTKRNSMGLANLRYNKFFFWDGQELSMEDQVLKPVENHIEMGMEDFDKLANKLSTIDYYGDLFEAAFGTSEVTEDRISLALAQFMRSMVSFDSKYDEGLANDFSNFNTLEKQGMELFQSHKAKCNDCHRPDHNFSVSWRGTVNIGLDMEYADKGAGGGSFRVPSLRNVAKTAPYMHDGRFATLEEVLDHYSEGIQNHPNLDWVLQDNGGPLRMNLTETEKQALIAFLGTLTDESYLNDPKFASPF